MIVLPALRTKDLAAAIGVSVQQVRNYEAAGFLPPVPRNANGYRRYEEGHLAALKAARLLIEAYGVQPACEIMRAVHAGAIVAALEQIDGLHAALNATRRQLDQTLAALTTLADKVPAPVHGRGSRRLRVSEAAAAIGAQVSALHFWESLGLVEPVRERGSNYRLYDERQLRRLRIIALLRQAHYSFDAIRATIAEVEAGQAGRALAAITERRAKLAALSWSRLEALAALHGYIRAYTEAAPPMAP